MARELDRREFAGMVLALGAAGLGQAEGQSGPGGQPRGADLKPLESGVFKAGPEGAPNQGRVGRRFLAGMLKAGNIRLEMHQTVQQVGAVHEPIGTHLHNEIWLMQRGVASLYINGTEHRMEAGDVGLVCAGDTHWIKNVGETELAYFVVTVGPPEP